MQYLININKILVVTLILSILIITPLTTLSQIEKPVVYNDPITFRDIGDLEKIEVNDNGTHLIVHSQWNNSLPTISGTYKINHVVSISVDRDMNPLTGGGGTCYRLQSGYEVVANGYNSSDGLRNFYMYWFASNGTQLGYASNSNYVASNTSGLYLSLPLTDLNLSTDNRSRILVFGHATFMDSFPILTHYNVTVNYTAVAIDGSDSEWNFSNSTLVLDSNDNYTVPYPGFNITGIYIASDNSYLYFLFKLDSPVNDSFFTSYTIDQATASYSASLTIDVDNDGVSDYYLSVYPFGVGVYNYSNSAYSFYHVPSAWNTSNVEIALNLSYMGLSSIVGQNISIRTYNWMTTIYDYLVPKEKYYGFLYRIGSGGRFIAAVNNYCVCGCTIPAGITTRSFGDLNLTMNLTSSQLIYMLEFNTSPVFSKVIGGTVSNYYKFSLIDETAISWPLTATITYNETLVSLLGYTEDNLTVYYYNYTSNRYEPLPHNQTIIDTSNNIIVFNITRTVYEAGDPIIALGGSSPAVGGKLVIYSENQQPALMIVLIALSMIAIPIVLIAKHNKERTR